MVVFLPSFCTHKVNRESKPPPSDISEDTASIRIHMPGAVAKTKKATNILRPAIDVTFDKDAEFEVFSDSRRFFHGFFLEKVTLYGEVAIKSR